MVRATPLHACDASGILQHSCADEHEGHGTATPQPVTSEELTPDSIVVLAQAVADAEERQRWGLSANGGAAGYGDAV